MTAMRRNGHLTTIQIRVLLGACGAYDLACVGAALVTGQLFFAAMAWNLFLAFLPLVFSQALIALTESPNGRRWKKVVLAVIWLASFPNAFYFTTDFIHLPNQHMTCTNTSCAPDMVFYGDLMVIAIGFLLSTYAGLRSLADVHGLIAESRWRRLAWPVISMICLLTGIGIYIGRFLRYNSWDLVQPWHIVGEFATRVSARGWGFIAMFTVYSLFIYCCFALLRKGARGADRRSEARNKCPERGSEVKGSHTQDGSNM
jgi:uncharacterized membrane protein